MKTPKNVVEKLASLERSLDKTRHALEAYKIKIRSKRYDDTCEYLGHLFCSSGCAYCDGVGRPGRIDLNDVSF